MNPDRFNESLDMLFKYVNVLQLLLIAFSARVKINSRRQVGLDYAVSTILLTDIGKFMISCQVSIKLIEFLKSSESNNITYLDNLNQVIDITVNCLYKSLNDESIKETISELMKSKDKQLLSIREPTPHVPELD